MKKALCTLAFFLCGYAAAEMPIYQLSTINGALPVWVVTNAGPGGSMPMGQMSTWHGALPVVVQGVDPSLLGMGGYTMLGELSVMSGIVAVAVGAGSGTTLVHVGYCASPSIFAAQSTASNCHYTNDIPISHQYRIQAYTNTALGMAFATNWLTATLNVASNTAAATNLVTTTLPSPTIIVSGRGSVSGGPNGYTDDVSYVHSYLVYAYSNTLSARLYSTGTVIEVVSTNLIVPGFTNAYCVAFEFGLPVAGASGYLITKNDYRTNGAPGFSLSTNMTAAFLAGNGMMWCDASTTSFLCSAALTTNQQTWVATNITGTTIVYMVEVTWGTNASAQGYLVSKRDILTNVDGSWCYSTNIASATNHLLQDHGWDAASWLASVGYYTQFVGYSSTLVTPYAAKDALVATGDVKVVAGKVTAPNINGRTGTFDVIYVGSAEITNLYLDGGYYNTWRDIPMQDSTLSPGLVDGLIGMCLDGTPLMSSTMTFSLGNSMLATSIITRVVIHTKSGSSGWTPLTITNTVNQLYLTTNTATRIDLLALTPNNTNTWTVGGTYILERTNGLPAINTTVGWGLNLRAIGGGTGVVVSMQYRWLK